MADHGQDHKAKEKKEQKKAEKDAAAKKQQHRSRARGILLLALVAGAVFYVAGGPQNWGFAGTGEPRTTFPWWGCVGSFEIKLTSKEIDVPKCYIDNIHATEGVVEAIGFLGKEKKTIQVRPYEIPDWPPRFELMWVRAQKEKATLAGSLSTRRS